MRKRKKRMKLPNGFGSIKYLGNGRRKPYAAYPPVKDWTAKGPVSPPALSYCETWEEAYAILTTYNLEQAGKIRVSNNLFIDRTPTFREVYDRFYDEKYNHSEKKLSKQSQDSTRAAFKNCSVLHGKHFGELRYEDLQNVVNKCTLKHSSIELIISLLKQMYKYALKYEIVEKDYSQFLYMPKEEDDEPGVPFSDDELKILWTHSTDPVIQMILIMCYSGFRIAAYTNIEVNLTDRYFKGGVKTKAGKNRIVPIHSAIYDFVTNRADKNMLHCTASLFRNKMSAALDQLGIERHTPHDCRHTFSVLCERYGVNENDRKRMLGHSFGSDITNAKYGHRTLEELRNEIEKIRIPQS